MKRLKLTLEYDGSSFVGWQEQANGPTVQGHLIQAMQELTGETVAPYASGRTDAGVHATGQVCHLDLTTDKAAALPLIRYLDGLNRYTPPAIQVTRVAHVSEGFHARFSAVARSYTFLLFNRRVASPLWANRAVHVLKPLDLAAMARAAEPLKGELDCEAFRASDCTAEHARCLFHHVHIHQPAPHVVAVEVKANRFVHNMVRILVGTLVNIGTGRLPETTIADALAHRDRTRIGQTLPPQGLYFTGVDFKPHEEFEVCGGATLSQCS